MAEWEIKDEDALASLYGPSDMQMTCMARALPVVVVEGFRPIPILATLSR